MLDKFKSNDEVRITYPRQILLAVMELVKYPQLNCDNTLELEIVSKVHTIL